MKQRGLFDVEMGTPQAAKENGLPEIRDYQIDVNERSRSHIPKGIKRILVQSETGSGKTYIIGYNAKSCIDKKKRVMILADRRKLVKQLAVVLHKFKVDYGVIMAEETWKPNADCVVVSRDTLAAWVARNLRMPAPYDLIIVDEAHGILGDTYQAILNLWRNSIVLGYTATPARGDGRFLSEFFQVLECAVSGAELIRRGWLTPTEIYCPLEMANKRKKGQKTGLAGNPVSHWQTHANDLPTVAFAETVDDSLSLMARFTAEGIATEHIDGNTPDAQREKAYDRLRSGETKVLCSVDLMIQGVDIEEISAIICWKKFGSIVEWRQANGRAKRPCERIGKRKAICLDHSGAAGIHGSPDDDVEWSLDPTTTVSQRKANNPNAKPMIICRKCGFCFSGRQVCPKCSTEVPRQRKAYSLDDQAAYRNAILEKYEGIPDAKPIIQSTTAKLYERILGIAARRNGTYKMVCALFRKETGIWPEQADLPGDTKIPPQHRHNEKIRDVYPELIQRRTA